MGAHSGKFRLNRNEGKVMGVCAGIADHFEMDVTLVRVAMALAIIMTMPVVLLAYLILAMVAESGGETRLSREEEIGARLIGGDSAEMARERMRDIDARMAAIESYVTSSNTVLAREIDELR